MLRLNRPILTLFALLSVLMSTACGVAATPAPQQPTTSAAAAQPTNVAPNSQPAAPSQPTFAPPNQPAFAPTALPTRVAQAQPTTIPIGPPTLAAAAPATAAPSGPPSFPNAPPPSNPDANAQQIARNAQLLLAVPSVDVAIVNIEGVARHVGGHLVSSHKSGGPYVKTGQIVVAVPVERYDEALSLIRRLALRVEVDNAGAQNITTQRNQLESQAQDLEANATRLRELLRKARTTAESLQINSQLRPVEQQLEAVKGQISNLDQKAAFSQITIDLREQGTYPLMMATATPTPWPTWTPVPPVPQVVIVVATPQPAPSRKSAVQSAVDTQAALLQTLGDLFVWFSIVVMPYVIVIAGIIWLFKALRR